MKFKDLLIPWTQWTEYYSENDTPTGACIRIISEDSLELYSLEQSTTYKMNYQITDKDELRLMMDGKYIDYSYFLESIEEENKLNVHVLYPDWVENESYFKKEECMNKK